MEINQIKYFLEVAKNEHITKSAEALHIAQPALTKSIHKLEEELNVPLFVQKGRNITITKYGLYLKEKLIPVMQELNEIPDYLNTLSKTESKTVRLNVLAASSMVTEAIIEYKKQNKNVIFKVKQTKESNLYDIGIKTSLLYKNKNKNENKNKITKNTNEVILNSGINPEIAFNEKIFLAVPKTHKFAKYKSINLNEAKEENFISLMGSREFRLICDTFCNKSGFSPKIIFESDSPAAVKNMIAANIGVGFWPEYSFGKIDNEHIKLTEIKNPNCHRNIIINYNSYSANNNCSYNFYSFLIDYFSKTFNAK